MERTGWGRGRPWAGPPVTSFGGGGTARQGSVCMPGRAGCRNKTKPNYIKEKNNNGDCFL